MSISKDPNYTANGKTEASLKACAEAQKIVSDWQLMFQLIHFLISCELQFSEVLLKNLKCAWVKLLLEIYLACETPNYVPDYGSWKFSSQFKSDAPNT